MRAILRDVLYSYRHHDGPLLAGALAFYIVMASTPFGVIALYVGGIFLGREGARTALLGRVRDAMGPEAETFANESLDAALAPQHGAWATVLSALFILFVTARIFHMLRASLNHLWGVRPTVHAGLRGEGWRVSKRRLRSFAMVFVAIGVFVAFVVVRAGIVVAARITHLSFLIRIGEVTASLASLTLIIALVFRWLPDAEVAWRDVFAGAFFTAVLAGIGGQLVGLYLASAGVASSYGAAGSIVMITLWVYYSCQIFLMGAAFTQAYARNHGAGISPLSFSTRVVVDRMTIAGEDA